MLHLIITKLTALLISFLQLISVLAGSAAYPRGQALDLSRFELTYEEEFDGASLADTAWKPHGNGIRRGAYWADSQAFLRDGNLVIRTEYKEDGAYGPGYYTQGLDTNGTWNQTYGYFEVRCILPKGAGLWSAFWMMPPSMIESGTGRDGAEIDIFESAYYSSLMLRNGVSSNIHFDGYGEAHQSTSVGVFFANNPYEEYNTYGLEWNEDAYIFYINGVETGRTSFGGTSQVPEYLLLSVEVGGENGVPGDSWAGNISHNFKSLFPSDFVVDYVRAYQYR